jgi:hypothetical protein
MNEESEVLQDEGDILQAEDDFREYQQELYFKRVTKMRDRYKDNATSQIGTTIRCACCGKRILKSNYQTQFCRNKGSGNCKDQYWNNVSETRRRRAQAINFAYQ